ncbi:MAG TPA: DUF4920 domain-containing protein [Vicinamibacterales bacterium]|nr:DUF4920 domain-containing protein [Vicinamibacterales bacterium]
MKRWITAAAVALAMVAVQAEETKLGAGVSLKETTPIKAIVEKPADYVGKTVRIDGVATAVCEDMGCWMAVAPEDDPTGPTVRLKVEDGVIVFPATAKGKKVAAEGVFEEIAPKDDHGKEAAGEHAKHDAKASKKYQIKATGAVIK